MIDKARSFLIFARSTPGRRLIENGKRDKRLLMQKMSERLPFRCDLRSSRSLFGSACARRQEGICTTSYPSLSTLGSRFRTPDSLARSRIGRPKSEAKCKSSLRVCSQIEMRAQIKSERSERNESSLLSLTHSLHSLSTQLARKATRIKNSRIIMRSV